jgi:crotonobetainyl-CoA:carnitine CoA-transferase CaiB-like acyl-CoA transferase
MYGTLSRGTRSLSIDLVNPAARPVFHRLVAASDLVIENFAGPVLEGWGCGYDDLIGDNPALVMLSLSGYGRSGPRAGYLAYASTICSFLGLSSAWGYTHGTLTDYLTAASGALAAVASLAEARAHGTPAYVDVAQIDAVAPILAGLYTPALNQGADPAPTPNRVPGSWLSGLFASRGVDAWLAVDIEDGADWAVLCDLLDRPDLAASGSAHALKLEPELRDVLARWTGQHSAHTGMHVLQRAGLAAAAVQDIDEIWRDPQLNVRSFGELVDQADLGPVVYPRSAQRWTKTPGALRHAPARLGQHTNEILREWIQLPGEELDRLASEEAIFDAGTVTHVH